MENPLGNIAKRIITDVLKKDSTLPNAKAPETTEKILTKINASPDIAVVKVQPAWQSKTQLAQYLGIAFTMLALFGLPIPEDVRAQVIAGGSSLVFVATWIIKRYSNTISPTAAQAMKSGGIQ